MRTLNLLSTKRVLGLLIVVVLASLLLPAVISANPPKQTGTFFYTVQYGDTLFSISRRFGTTVPTIMTANGLTSDYIYAGQRLIIPVGPPGPLPTPVGYDCKYAVQFRDTVYSIAYRYKVTWYALMQANYLYAPYITVGMQLNVPCLTPAPTPFPTYVVQSGDNLFRLAIKNETSVYAIALVNGIYNPHWIWVGQNLIIPYPGTVKWPVVPTITPSPFPFTPGLLTPTPTTVGAPTPTATPTSTGSAVVVMTNLTFIPNSVTVRVGTTVLWQNTESVTHTVSSGVPGALDYRFRSGPLGVGQTFSFNFTSPGVYPYFSELDQGMTGTITVQ